MSIYELALKAEELKKRLVEFYEQNTKKYKPILAGQLAAAQNEAQRCNVIDWFIFCYRFRDGDTMLRKFILANELTNAQTEIVLGWEKSAEAFFQIVSIADDKVGLKSLFDYKDYTIAVGNERQLLQTLQTGQFILSRVLPVNDFYVLSGIPHVFPKEGEKHVRKMVADLLEANPNLAGGSAAQQADTQARYRQAFINYFGSEFLVQSTEELEQSLNQFIEQWNKGEAEGGSRQSAQGQPIVLPDNLKQYASVGVICDEAEGLCVYPELGEFIAVFENPELVVQERYRQVVLGYLTSNAVSLAPFRKMYEKYPKNVGVVFKRLLDRKRWSGKRDFDAVMKKYKAAFINT